MTLLLHVSFRNEDGSTEGWAVHMTVPRIGEQFVLQSSDGETLRGRVSDVRHLVFEMARPPHAAGGHRVEVEVDVGTE